MEVLSNIVFSEIIACDNDVYRRLDEFLFFSDHTLGNTLLNENKFYTGLIPFLQENGFEINVTKDYDDFYLDDIVRDPLLKNRILRDYQKVAVRKALSFRRGILQLCTGAGKTEIIGSTISHLNLQGIKKVVVMVPTVFLMQQTYDKLRSFGIPKITRLGGGHQPRDRADILVCVANSAHRKLIKGNYDPIEKAEVLILDEAHHTRSKTWVSVAESCNATIRLAFTATALDDPFKWSYEDLQLIGLTGPLVMNVKSKSLRRRGFLADPLVTMIRYPYKVIEGLSWHKAYNKGIVENTYRNSTIISLTNSLYLNNYKTIVFINNLSHGHLLSEKLSYLGVEVLFVHGGSTVFVYKQSGSVSKSYWPISKVGDYVSNSKRCVIVTSTVMDEGVDFPAVNALVMGTGMKKYRRSVQRAGRGMRPKKDGGKVFIFDFFDDCHRYLANQSNYRLSIYENEEFDITESIEHTKEVMQCDLDLNFELL